MQPLKQLASIGTPEPQQIVIRPYDAGTIKEIEKAIVAGDLGLNPQSDGRIIRLNVPALSTEVRKKMVSRIKELAEEAKISIRNIRRDANKAADAAEKSKEISEDDRDKTKEEIQELTKKFETQGGRNGKISRGRSHRELNRSTKRRHRTPTRINPPGRQVEEPRISEIEERSANANRHGWFAFRLEWEEWSEADDRAPKRMPVAVIVGFLEGGPRSVAGRFR